MLPKRSRLVHADFSKKPIRSMGFLYGSIKFIPGSARAAVVVSKKVAASAVLRNTLRRRTYVALRPLLPRLRGSLVIHLNKHALTASVADLSAALHTVLH